MLILPFYFLGSHCAAGGGIAQASGAYLWPSRTHETYALKQHRYNHTHAHSFTHNRRISKHRYTNVSLMHVDGVRSDCFQQTL